MHPRRAHGALEGDDLEIPLQHGGASGAGALERHLGEVAHHPEHKTLGVVLASQLHEGLVQVTAGAEFERHRTHGGSRETAWWRPAYGARLRAHLRARLRE